MTVVLSVSSFKRCQDLSGNPLSAQACAAVNVRALLASGANPRLTDKSDKTALELVPQGQGHQVSSCDATRRLLQAK